MIIIEKCYSIWKRFKKKVITKYKAYFTIEGTYTSLLPDKVYLKKKYKSIFNKELNLKNPKTFNEKMQWIKLYDRNPLYTTLVDKYKVREYVKERIGEEYLIPLLGVWNSPYDIDFDKLPNQFVLKCNHDSNVFICRDKTKCEVRDKKQSYSNFDEVKNALDKRLKTNYYKANREWPYKNVERKIICEKYMEDENSDSLVDYKFFSFNGKVKALFVATGRFSDVRFDFFDTEYKHLPIINGHPNSNELIRRPETFHEMIWIAEKLSMGLPNARIDLYEINHKVFFSEITLFHFSGFTPFEPDKWDRIFGNYIDVNGK